MIIIVFGLAGSGKTHIGKLMARHFGFHAQDADQWLLDDMLKCIEIQENFTLEMLDRFTSEIVRNIKLLKTQHPKLVISQALYRTKNREEILRHFPAGEVAFLQADSSDEVILQRLISRGDSICPEYASKMREYFQEMEGAPRVSNDEFGNEGLVRRLEKILNNIA